MAASLRKAYIDSRRALPGGTGANFIWESPEEIVTGPTCAVSVVDIQLPQSWQTVTAGRNDHVYWLEHNVTTNTIAWRVLTLAPGVYTATTLSIALQTALNGPGANRTITGTYTVVYDTVSNHMTVSLSSADNFQAIGDDFLSPYFFWLPNRLLWDHPYDRNNLMSANSLLGLIQTQPYFTFSNPWTSSVIDVRSIDAVYLHSSALTSSVPVLGPEGSRSVLKKINVQSVFGSVISESSVPHAQDAVVLPDVSLRQLDFQLKDYNGNVVDLNGGSVSFALLFGQAVS